MKHIITIGALLAAGTALANAEGVKKIDFTNASDTVSLTDFEGNSVTVVGLLDVEKLKTAMIAGADLQKIHLFELSGSTAGGNIGVTTNYSSESNKIKTSGLYGIAGDAENRNIGMNIGTLHSEESSFWEGVTLASLALTTSSVGDFGTTAVLSLLQNGTAKTFGGTVDGRLRYKDQVFKTLAIDTSRVLSGYVQNSQVGVEELKRLSVAAIPEPSAFGLLAGAGALALVAARRRRKA